MDYVLLSVYSQAYTSSIHCSYRYPLVTVGGAIECYVMLCNALAD